MSRLSIQLAWISTVAAVGCLGSDPRVTAQRSAETDPSEPPVLKASAPHREATVLARAPALESADRPPEVRVDPARSCETDDDCVHPTLPEPVAHEGQCYCPVCPGDFGRLPPVNRNTHAQRREAWEAHCSRWAESECEEQLCPRPRDAVCNSSGLCELPAWEPAKLTGQIPTPARPGK